MYKKYKCCICHKTLEKMPIRLVKQVGDNKDSYRAFHNKGNYDFCIECYKKFEIWVRKNNI